MKRYFTENKKEITDRVKNGLTVIFLTRLEAEKYARLKRSYPFEVFNIDFKPVGWGVSK
ncbi:hypothetical protein OBK05_02280 [Empedobacter falsenii]